MKLRYAFAAVAIVAIWSANAKAADLLKPAAAAPVVEAPAAPASPIASCYVGGSVGMGSTVTRISDTEYHADLGSDGYIGGGEVGCDMSLSAFVVGGLVRYDFNNLGGSIDGSEVDAGGVWTVAAKAGMKLNQGAVVYGLIGLAGTKIKVEDVASASHRGWMAGAGVELAIANSPISIFAEYNYLDLGSKTYTDADDASASIDPVTHIGRIGGRLRF